MPVVDSYSPSGLIPGVPVTRFFKVEDRELNGLTDGFYINGDAGVNSVTPTSAALPLGALLPGNLVYVDNASANTSNPNVKRPLNTPTTAMIASLSNAQLGVVYGEPYFRYAATDNAIYAGEPVSVLKGRFTAILDANSFSTAPTAIGQKVYADSSGVAANAGKFSTVLVGSTGTADLALGVVLGFENFTYYGTPGVQVTGTYAANAITAATSGGKVLVRVSFDLPYYPRP